MKKPILLIIFAVFLLLNSLFTFADLKDGLVSYYKFDETSGTTALDSTLKYNGTLSDSRIFGTDGKINKGADFTKGDDIITIGTQGNPRKNLTICYWQYGNSQGNDHIVGNSHRQSWSTIGYALGHNDITNVYVWQVGRDGGTGESVISSAYNEVGWNFICGVLIVSKNMTIYRNAVSIASESTTITETPNTGYGWIIGREWRTEANKYANVLIDEVAIYNRSLSLSEISELYNNGKGDQYPFIGDFIITAKNRVTNAPISNFTATINGVLYSSNNDSEIVTPFLKNESFLANINVFADNYFTKSYTGYLTDTNLDASMTPSGFLEFEIKNQNTNSLITDLVNITIQDSTSQNTYNTTTGNFTVLNLVEQNLYNIFLKTQNFVENQYTFIYSSSTPIPYIMYMLTTGEEIRFITKDTGGNLLGDVDYIVEKFVGSNFTTISQKMTDISGTVRFILDRGETHRITIQRDGYVGKSFLSTLGEDDYTVVLDTDTSFDFVGSVGGIKYSYSPKSQILSPNATQQFKLELESANSDLMSYSIQIYNGTTLLKVKSGNTPTGETLIETFDTTPYNNSNIIVQYSFTRLNYTTYQIPVMYKIMDQLYDNNIFNMRDFMIANISLRNRVVIWVFLLVTFTLIFSIFQNGYLAVFAIAMMSPMLGWFVGINVIILGVISFILAFSVFANQRGSI